MAHIYTRGTSGTDSYGVIPSGDGVTTAGLHTTGPATTGYIITMSTSSASGNDQVRHLISDAGRAYSGD